VTLVPEVIEVEDAVSVVVVVVVFVLDELLELVELPQAVVKTIAASNNTPAPQCARLFIAPHGVMKFDAPAVAFTSSEVARFMGSPLGENFRSGLPFLCL
jgi:hypothetical protein